MTSQMLKCDVAVVGGGLAGLTAASLLSETGRDVLLLEASSQVGGRVKSVYRDDDYVADLGPTWIWPVYQPTVARWVEQLGVKLFPQYEEGNAVLDFEPGVLPSHQFLPGQHGMARIDGGPQSLVDALASTLSNSQIITGAKVADIDETNHGFLLRSTNCNDLQVTANKAIFAAPLRLIAETVEWNSLLSDDLLELMANAPTWMATQAKVSVVYQRAFWRDAGLSGRVASRVGPMFEVHDHCGADGQPAALFGFVGWSPKQRKSADLGSAIVDQLVRCFGEEAREFEQLVIQDWASEPHICSKRDYITEPQHPAQLPQQIRSGMCEGRIFFAAAETATQSPGLIDGAFEAGERVARQVAGQSYPEGITGD